MKKSIVLCAAGLASVACGVQAQEYGRVLSSTPVIQQVAVPRQVCSQQPVVVQQERNLGGGALMGAIAGGAVGNAIGDGGGRAAATAIGLLGGALLGHRIEGGGQPQQVYAQPVCTTQTTYENRAVAYNVTYEYAGKQYTVQMPQDPGPTVRLQVTPVGANSAAPPAENYAAPAAQEPAPVAGAPVATVIREVVTVPQQAAYPAYPVYSAPPAYYAPPAAYYAPRPYYYPPVGLSLNFGYSRGHRHHRHHRHR